MISQQSRILKNTAITKDLFVLEVEFDQNIQSGQFVMLRLNDNSRILPRPISVFKYDQTNKILSLLIRIRGEGSRQLSLLKENDSITIFGAMGKGFPETFFNKRVFLMGGGEGIAPMLHTSNILKQNNELTIFAGFRHFQESKVLQYFDQNLSIHCAAIDHPQIENRGLITSLLHGHEAPDIILSCGPTIMMEAICTFIQTHNWNTQLYVSMENRMACGVGACMGCTIPSAQNQEALIICKKGPVFLAEEVFHG